MPKLEYFLKRLLLIIPTFIGITILCFGVCWLVPGGPVEQMVAQIKQGKTGGGEVGGGGDASARITPEQLEAIKKHFGFDKPFHEAYWEWLYTKKMGLTAPSFRFPDRSAWDMIASRMKVSLIFGLTGFFFSYLICIPLGIAKALRNNSTFDFATSTIVFIGYAIPPFAFGMVLKMLFSGTNEQFWDFFPHARYISENHDMLTSWGQFLDIAHHMFLPVLCYMVGHFAFLTILMKNSLLDEVSKDYARTARAKGCTLRRTIWVHVLRNSLIPIATGIGGILTVMFAGSVLIEQVFEIPGMGKLSLESIVNRDYSVFMCIMALTSVLGLLGRIVSDLCYLLIDPRIDFSK